MSAPKLDVLWSPTHYNKFIIWGTDITLYEVARLKEIEKKSTFIRISPTRGATVLASQSGTGVRCLDASYVVDGGPLLALGNITGRVSLTGFAQDQPLGLSGREFVPRYSRPCNSVAWSPLETNLLAAALDKNRSDHCILLWDVNKNSVPDQIPGAETVDSRETEESRPFAEMGLSETAHEVSWAHFSNRTLFASMNYKYIKIFDLRELSKKAVSCVSTRQCVGVCAEPGGGWRFAARGCGGSGVEPEGGDAVCVWDARALTRPLLTLPQPRPVTRLHWCPTRRNLLVSLLRDSNTLRLHDIQQSDAIAVEELDSLEQYAAGVSVATPGSGGDSHVLERDVSPGPLPLAAFACHPTHPTSILTVSLSGVISEYTVCERVTVAWGASGGVAWAVAGGDGVGVGGDGGGGVVRVVRDEVVGDVSQLMRRRAQTDYGLKPDLWQNADLADDESLASMWQFLALSKSLVEDGCIRNSPWKHPGVRTVLRPPGEGGYRSEIVPSLLPDMPNRRITIYRSVERSRALQLCGWGWGWDNAGVGVERAEADGHLARAAALAAFHLRLRTALDILMRASDPQLRLVGLAVAGLSEERLWREACVGAASSLDEPYLRALLHFAAATAQHTPAPASTPHTPPPAPPSPDLTAVLNETGMRLEDRVAFACIFLSDAKLLEYVRQTCDTLVEQGELSGLLLTGASAEGVPLVQRWLDNGGDVQSAAWLAARALPPDLLRDPRVQGWLHSYRNILDSWQLWAARSALDTWVNAGGGGSGTAGAEGECVRRVSAACTYCGKGVAAAPAHTRARAAFARLPPPAAKMKQISSCPNCRKPLPRCGVCSLHLGTVGAGAGAGAPFSGWFSWCVACRHGGHAAHLLHWFRDHTECPVSSCSCRCITLDPSDRSDTQDRPDPTSDVTPDVLAARSAHSSYPIHTHDVHTL